MTKVRNGVETLPKISIVWVGCTNVADETTDRQTKDGRTTTYSELFTFANNNNNNGAMQYTYTSLLSHPTSSQTSFQHVLLASVFSPLAFYAIGQKIIIIIFPLISLRQPLNYTSIRYVQQQSGSRAAGTRPTHCHAGQQQQSGLAQRGGCQKQTAPSFDNNYCKKT